MAPDPPIVRTDFPAVRRGWDPEAVRAHLEDVEGHVRDLRARAASPPTVPPTAARTTSAQVREVLEAAERSAQAILAAAEEHAARTRAAAAEEADRSRAAVQAVAERAHDLDRRLAGLAEALREGTGVGEPPAGAAAEPAASAEGEPPAIRAPDPPQSHVADDPAAGPSAEEHEAEARFAAVQLALDGRSRGEVERHLAEHYAVVDRAAIVDDAFALAGVEG